MRVIVGLGNPGRKYARTRHNAGFLAVEALAKRWKLEPIRWTDGEAGEGLIDGEKVVVVRPSTFMNLSGAALRPLDYLPDTFDRSTHLLVICDDFAIPLGTIRLRPSGSAGGHNGLLSVEAALQSSTYPRLRVGVGPLPPGIGDWAEFVLGPWAPGELEAIESLMPTIMDAVECWALQGIDVAMNRFNRKPSPPDETG